MRTVAVTDTPDREHEGKVMAAIRTQSGGGRKVRDSMTQVEEEAEQTAACSAREGSSLAPLATP
jgi:hypothetical protein